MNQRRNQDLPNPTENQRKVNTQPSLGLLRKIFGGPMSESMQSEWPELQREFVKREFDMPQEAAATNRMFRMGPVMKWLNPDAYAVTGPLGTIALNRELIEKDKQNLGDVLTHELTHIGQGKRGFLRNIYEPSVVENEAINREALRYRPRDVNLPVEKGIKIGPTSAKLQKLVK